MSEAPRSRRELWDKRHATRDPIESHEADATLVEVAGELVPGRALALERARAAAERAGVTVAWVLADLLEWQPPRGAFDLVGVVYLHLPPAERAAAYACAADAAVRAVRPPD